MCRLLVFKGTEPIQISHLVTKPAHSIINQAFDARLRLDATRSVNGDGFGVGWYDASLAPSAAVSAGAGAAGADAAGPSGSGSSAHRADGSGSMASSTAGPAVEQDEDAPRDYDYNSHPNAPCIFTSVTPAWNNANLHRLADKIRSPLIFAHVRASTAGALSETNCHPWRYGRLMWMHNGQISCFSKVKRRLLAALPEELFLYPQGHTDSELAFCVFLSHLRDPLRRGAFAWRELRAAMLATIADFNRWAREAGVQEPSLMNFVVSDGESVVCTRYVSSRTEEAASLYFSSGTSFYEDKGEAAGEAEGQTQHSSGEPDLPPSRAPGRYRMVKADKREKIIVVASEPLTFEKADWIQIPTNTLVAITPRMNVLQQPIEDEFATPAHAAAGAEGTPQRRTEFAIKAGYQTNVPVGHAAAAASRQRSESVPLSPLHNGVLPLHAHTHSLGGARGASPSGAHKELHEHESSASGPSSPLLARRPSPSGARAPPGPSQLSLQAPARTAAAAAPQPSAADALVSRFRAKPKPSASASGAKAPATGPSALSASGLATAGGAAPVPAAATSDAQRQPLPLLKPSGKLRLLDSPSSHTFMRPRKRIVSARALRRFEQSATFDEVLSFIGACNAAVVGRRLRDDVEESEAVRALLALLGEVERLVEETPADRSSGSRFGNAAFRDFYAKVKQATPRLLASLPGMPPAAVDELAVYVEESWGNEKRIDYGSGMELNFACFLLCLVKLRVVDMERDAPALVLRVFWRYITVMRKIQSQYWLEPAGSHGVWGLDDYHFLPFLWGSGQLQDHKHLKPKSIHDAEILEEFSDDSMYFACIRFINSIKTASLRWHSPMLDDISGVKTWAKVNEGMQKMYRAEVLLKLPIAQHIFFGSLLEHPELAAGEVDEEEGAEEDEHGHIHGKHGHGEGQAAGWGDCCGIPIPSVFAAAEQEKSEAQTASAYAQGARPVQQPAVRRIPFD